MKKLIIFGLLILIMQISVNVLAEPRSSIARSDITWTFDRDYECGQFANGDWWVVGPVNIESINPSSTEYQFLFTSDATGVTGGTLAEGEIVQQEGSNAMATVITQFDHTGTYIDLGTLVCLKPISGTFDVGAVITGNTSGASFTPAEILLRIDNGSEINPVPDTNFQNVEQQGYDTEWGKWHTNFGRIHPDGNNRYDPAKNVGFNVSAANPLAVQVNSSLISSDTDPRGSCPMLITAAVLTVLSAQPADGSFRPAYVGTNKTITHNISNLDYTKLKRIPTADGIGPADFEDNFEGTWIDYIAGPSARYLHPLNIMPDYGEYIATQIGDAALALNLDVSDAEKETLLIRFVQLGLDLYNITKNDGTRLWQNNGGHASGRKWPILFAGIVLNDAEIMGIGQRSGDYLYANGHDRYNPPDDYIHFGEDDQTFYVTQEDVDITHSDQWSPDSRAPELIPYEQSDIGLPEWGIVNVLGPHRNNKGWGASYRQCCNAVAWSGIALSVHIMDAKELWNHDAFFDYQDRYMQVNDGQPLRQNSSFVTTLWDVNRDNYLPVWRRYNSSDIYSQGYLDGVDMYYVSFSGGGSHDGSTPLNAFSLQEAQDYSNQQDNLDKEINFLLNGDQYGDFVSNSTRTNWINWSTYGGEQAVFRRILIGNSVASDYNAYLRFYNVKVDADTSIGVDAPMVLIDNANFVEFYDNEWFGHERYDSVAPVIRGNNVTVENTEIHYSTSYGPSAVDPGGKSRGINIFAGQNILIKNCNIHDYSSSGISLAPGTGGTIDGCHIYNQRPLWPGFDDNTGEPKHGSGIALLASNWTIRNNTINACGASGGHIFFYEGGVDNIIIENNLFYDGKGLGMQSDGSWGDNCKFNNNIVVTNWDNNPPSTSPLRYSKAITFRFDQSHNNFEFYNNVIIGYMETDGTDINAMSGNNIIYSVKPVLDWSGEPLWVNTGFGESTIILNSDIQGYGWMWKDTLEGGGWDPDEDFFENPVYAIWQNNSSLTWSGEVGDFNIKEGSPAIGFANPSYAPRTDIRGYLRDSAPDAGCYEYGATASVDPDPQPEPQPEPQPTTYQLDISISGNGTVIKNPDKPAYDDGESVSIQAIPDTGYVFTSWSGDVEGTENPITISMDANKSIGVQFEAATSVVPEADDEVTETKLVVQNNILKATSLAPVAINVQVKEPGHLRVKIYDSKGREIISLYDGHSESTVHPLTWGGNDSGNKPVGSGIYYVHVEIGNYSETKKIAVIK